MVHQEPADQILVVAEPVAVRAVGSQQQPRVLDAAGAKTTTGAVTVTFAPAPVATSSDLNLRPGATSSR
jgi:hypothetical protein